MSFEEGEDTDTGASSNGDEECEEDQTEEECQEESESSYCSIPDNCIRIDIVNGYIRQNKIDQLIHPQILSNDIKSLISMYYRYLAHFNTTMIDENQKLQLLKLLIKEKLFNSVNNVKINLLFDAKSNNYSASKFHEICDNIPDILVIIQTTTGSIYGFFSRPPYQNDRLYLKYWSYNEKTFVMFRLSSDIENYSNIDSMYRDTSKTKPGRTYNMNTPKVFTIDKGYTTLQYDLNMGPCTFGVPMLKIADKCNRYQSNTCHHDYNYGDLGIEICGTMEEIGGINCWNSWAFTVDNYQVLQIQHPRLNKMTQEIIYYAELSSEEEEDEDD